MAELNKKVGEKMKKTLTIVLSLVLLLLSFSNAYAESVTSVPPAHQISSDPDYSYVRWENSEADVNDGNQSRAGEDGLEIMCAESGISAGSRSIYVTASTYANLNTLEVGGYIEVQVYRDDHWEAYTGYEFLGSGSSKTVERTFSVEPNYYYRVQVLHYALTHYTYRSLYTTTQSVLVN